MSTDANTLLGAPLDMASMSFRPTVARSFEHATNELACGVTFLAENPDTEISSELGRMLERHISAIKELARAEAETEAKFKPRPLPSWLIPALVTIIIALVSAITGALVAWGAVQNRVANLELQQSKLEVRTQSVERLGSVETKVDILIDSQHRLEQRVNDLVMGARPPGRE